MMQAPYEGYVYRVYSVKNRHNSFIADTVSRLGPDLELGGPATLGPETQWIPYWYYIQ